jgi:hypothetical protein
MRIPRPRFSVRQLMIVVAVMASLLGIMFRDEVDIQRGRTRSGIYLWGIPIFRISRDSALSRVLSPVRGDEMLPDWRPVNTFTLYSPSISPHHAFHIAIAQIRWLSDCWGRADFTPSAKRQSAETVLRLWRNHDHYGPAGDYIEAVRMLTPARAAQGKTIDVGDLPAAP